MNNNFTDGQIPRRRGKIPSWAWGIITIVLASSSVIVLGLVNNYIIVWIFGTYSSKSIDRLFFILTILYHSAIFILATGSLIRGVKELKLGRKMAAIIGITLCSIGLMLTIVVGLFNVFLALGEII